MRIASDRTITVELTRVEAVALRRLLNSALVDLPEDSTFREDLYNGLTQHIYEEGR